MHITASRPALASALAAVAKALPARPTSPAFGGITLQAVCTDGTGVLVLTAGDGENWIRTRIACTCDADGIVSVPGSALAELVKDLPGDTVDITVTDDRIHLKLEKGSYSLPRFTDVPVGTPKLEDPQLLVSGPELAEAISRASAAVSRNQAVPVLAGIKVEIEGGVLTLASTDRYRLAVTNAGCNGQDGISIDTIIPAKQLADVAKVLGKAEAIGISYADGTLSFSTPDTAVFVRELAGEYPAWRRLLAATPTTWVETDTAELLGAVRRTGRLSPDMVTLTISGDCVTVAAAGTEIGSGSEDITATTTPAPDEDVEIRFNPEILLDGLTTTGTRTIRLGFSDPLKAVILTGSDAHTYLAMPRR